MRRYMMALRRREAARLDENILDQRRVDEIMADVEAGLDEMISDQKRLEFHRGTAAAPETRRTSQEKQMVVFSGPGGAALPPRSEHEVFEEVACQVSGRLRTSCGAISAQQVKAVVDALMDLAAEQLNEVGQFKLPGFLNMKLQETQMVYGRRVPVKLKLKWKKTTRCFALKKLREIV
jgi:nucleoid DNA-binding protein